MSDKILDRVNSPLDLKTLTLAEMNQLAAEIRQMEDALRQRFTG